MDIKSRKKQEIYNRWHKEIYQLDVQRDYSRFAHINKTIVKYLEITKNSKGKLLDVPCGKGLTLKAVSEINNKLKLYGSDISDYAVSQADKDVEPYLSVVQPYQSLAHDQWYYSWILAKDVLEHIPYDKIDDQLKRFDEAANGVFAIIPMGDGNKYYVDAYEHDQSHFIREGLEFWVKAFQTAGFDNVYATYDLGPFKTNWQQYKNGNGLFIATKTNRKFG